MKKSLFIIATLASLSIFSCQKEVEKIETSSLKPGTPEIDSIDEGILSEITAIAGDVETKTFVDGLQVKWSPSDVIAVADEDNAVVEFSLKSGDNTASATFTGDLSGKALGTYAVYPSTTNSLFGSNEVFVDYLDSWDYGKSEIPMYGVNDGTGTYTFYNIGGAIQVTYSGIPETANNKLFKLTETHTGGAAKYITGLVDISNLDTTPTIDLSSLDGQVVTIDNIAKDATDLTLVIPVPAGTGYNFKIELFEAGGATPIVGSVKNASNRTITAGKILRFPSIKVKADKNETLWSEDFTGLDDDDQPTSSTVTVFNGGSAAYAYDGTYTKIYASSGSLGGVPELLIAKSSRSETWVVSKIPTGSWDQLCLTYKANQNLTITSSDVTVGAANYEAITDKYGTYTHTISDAGSLTSFTLTFSMATDSNARIDDILLTAGAPEPSITVTTSVASSISASGATLNGTVALHNDAVLGTVTSAGFYYKKTSAAAYTQVFVTTPLVSTSFSKTLSELDQVEYTYYAFAAYDSGVEVTGSTQTFTPTSTPATSTATLSSTNMSNMSNAGTGYGTTKSITVGDYTWNTNGYQSDTQQDMIQLRIRTHKNGVSWVQLPTFPGNIQSVYLKVTGAGASDTSYASGSNPSTTIAIQAGTTKDETVILSGSPASKQLTLDLSSKSIKTGYIVMTAGSGFRIWEIVVTYNNS